MGAGWPGPPRSTSSEPVLWTHSGPLSSPPGLRGVGGGEQLGTFSPAVPLWLLMAGHVECTHRCEHRAAISQHPSTVRLKGGSDDTRVGHKGYILVICDPGTCLVFASVNRNSMSATHTGLFQVHMCLGEARGPVAGWLCILVCKMFCQV